MIMMIKVWIEDDESAVHTLSLKPNMEYTLVDEVPAKYWSDNLTLRFHIKAFVGKRTISQQ
jgi:hypothetical protein